MSVVVAYKKENIIYMGCDFQVSMGNYKSSLHEDSFKKIHVTQHNIILGITGSVSNAMKLLSLSDQFDALKDQKLTKERILKYIINPYINALKESKTLKIYQGMHDLELVLFIAKGSDLFFVDDDATILEVETYAAIGSGAAATHVILKHGKGSPNAIIKQSLEYATRYDWYVGKPYLYINTQDYILRKEDSDDHRI